MPIPPVDPARSGQLGLPRGEDHPGRLAHGTRVGALLGRVCAAALGHDPTFLQAMERLNGSLGGSVAGDRTAVTESLLGDPVLLSRSQNAPVEPPPAVPTIVAVLPNSTPLIGLITGALPSTGDANVDV